MRHYIMPQTEEIKLANKVSELRTASPAPVGNVYLPVAHGATNVVAE